ncbi:hypothetical protein CDAR_453631 [Caerostris darwini]|uniref:C2H2-type domain-containing protein n=1 Tax=Caerostris darwini TaxID=1538125 RepID=A0AAV4NX94_9ARAC|nr:hypothetical protein CDAR_453631 [Caerostris darwini]
MKIIGTPVKESSIQMAIMNTSSVMSSKIEDHLGILVEITTNLAEASSVPVEPRKYSNRTSNLPARNRPYACHIHNCASRFFRNCDLTRHLKIHTAQKPFQCSACGRSFLHSHSLITHSRTHSGEKPYSCDTCG